MSKRLKVAWLAVPLVVLGSLAVVASVGAKRSATVSQIGYASPEKPNDYGWNQQGFVSARRAARTQRATVLSATGIGYENVEPALRRLAQRGADLIIAQASGYNTIAPRVAEQFRVPTLVYDNPRATRRPYVADVETRAQEGAYLAGVLAARQTRTRTLGIVVSAADTNWFKQSGGFIAGARSVNKRIRFRYARIGQASYADAAGGRRVTQQVIAAGADIVFGMGDGSSFGMLQAVQTARAPRGARKVYFIDVIGNKRKVDRRRVLLTSVIWDFTQIFNQAIRDVEANRFGQRGYVLTVRNGLSLLRTNQAPRIAWSAADRARRRIISGRITIPLTATERSVKRLCRC
ncbi:MAG: BMP family ABC transporter substrate-binding protein [Actinomycetota bacterium]|nr:BMP family ABC transporter substrate-binding protein [Actinomycetota bacterium]